MQGEDKRDDMLQTVSSYWDTRSEGYDAQVAREEETGAFGRYEAFLGDVKGARVLDIGCGPGFFACELARRGARVTALDISEGMLEKTKKRAAAAGLDVETLLADSEALPFADGSFDLVCSRNVVWNLVHPETAYREWLRVLGAAGRLVVFDGNHYRHYFDERYARARKAPLPNDNHILLGVPTNRIDDLARELPLGRCQRPQWDETELAALGVATVKSRTLTTITDPETNESLVFDFVVVARKS